MRNLFSQLWADDNGVVGLEYLVLATIIGLGLVVGAATVAHAIGAEYTELANAIGALNQAYGWSGFSTCVASKGGNAVADTSEFTHKVNIAPSLDTLTETICP